MLPFEGPAAQGTASVRCQQETEGTHWETGLLDKEAIYKGVAACREVTIEVGGKTLRQEGVREGCGCGF